MSRTFPHGLLARLGDLDPAGEYPQRRASAQDVTLQHILESSRRPRSGDFLPRRRSGPIAAASIVLVLVLVFGTVVWNMSGAPAYATWTAEPEEVSAQQAEEVAQSCPMVAHEIVGDVDDPQVQEFPLEPVLIDVRGDYVYVIGADDEGRYAECFLSSDGHPHVVTSDAGVGPEADVVLSPPEQGAEVLHAGTASWSEGADDLPGALTSAYGRSADDVAEVLLATDDGEQVHATVQDGWWVAWVPGDEAFTGEMTVVDTDGTASTQDLRVEVG